MFPCHLTGGRGDRPVYGEAHGPCMAKITQAAERRAAAGRGCGTSIVHQMSAVYLNTGPVYRRLPLLEVYHSVRYNGMVWPTSCDPADDVIARSVGSQGPVWSGSVTYRCNNGTIAARQRRGRCINIAKVEVYEELCGGGVPYVSPHVRKVSIRTARSFNAICAHWYFLVSFDDMRDAQVIGY